MPHHPAFPMEAGKATITQMKTEDACTTHSSPLQRFDLGNDFKVILSRLLCCFGPGKMLKSMTFQERFEKLKEADLGKNDLIEVCNGT